MLGVLVATLCTGTVLGDAPRPEPTIRNDLRADGVPVALMPPGHMEAEFRKQGAGSNSEPYPYTHFSEAYVQNALASGMDWREKGAVTPAKDQGRHGYCGTFGRVASAEGQYATRSGYGLRNFSEEELVDCIGWDRDQFSYFQPHGFMDSAAYPYNGTGPDVDPPIPDKPCRFMQNESIPGTASGHFTGTIRVPANDEEQLAAFLYHNGPVQTGINANVLGLRAKGCESTGDCFITQEACSDPKIKGHPINHSVTLVGFGVDPVHGAYWIVKNSWSTNFGNAGFIKVAMGVNCASIGCCGAVFTYGDPASYFEKSHAPAAILV